MNPGSLTGYLVFALFIAFGLGLAHLLVVQHRLMSYLMNHHHERWCYLTTVGSSAPGLANGLRAVPYLYSDQDNDDPEVVRLKSSVKRSVLILAGVSGAVLLIALVCFVAIFVSGFVRGLRAP
jgi:hypothetical protein